MTTGVIFTILSLLIIAVSWRTIGNIRSHGFYRFLCWECIAWLLANNYRNWFVNPLSLHQIISWILLIIAAYLVIHSVILFRKRGKPGKDRADKNLYQFEQTTALIDNGIYKYIRHPLYASLLFLSWGILLKQVTVDLFVTTMLSTTFLYLTAILEEKECIAYFGEQYSDHMKRTKRFIPFVI